MPPPAASTWYGPWAPLAPFVPVGDGVRFVAPAARADLEGVFFSLCVMPNGALPTADPARFPFRASELALRARATGPTILSTVAQGISEHDVVEVLERHPGVSLARLLAAAGAGALPLPIAGALLADGVRAAESVAAADPTAGVGGLQLGPALVEVGFDGVMRVPIVEDFRPVAPDRRGPRDEVLAAVVPWIVEAARAGADGIDDAAGVALEVLHARARGAREAAFTTEEARGLLAAVPAGPRPEVAAFARAVCPEEAARADVEEEALGLAPLPAEDTRRPFTPFSDGAAWTARRARHREATARWG